MEKAKEEKVATGEIETHHPGYLGAQDTYYVGTIKGVGRIYQQTFIDTYSKTVQLKLYDRKNALVAADLTKARSPQANGICERFHRTVQEEFYAVAFRKKIFRPIVAQKQEKSYLTNTTSLDQPV